MLRTELEDVGPVMDCLPAPQVQVEASRVVRVLLDRLYGNVAAPDVQPHVVDDTTTRQVLAIPTLTVQQLVEVAGDEGVVA